MKSRTRKIFILFFIVFLACQGGIGVGIAQAKLKTAKRKEYEIKAAFVYNILKFIDWPPVKKENSASEVENKAKPKNVLTIGFVADQEIFEAGKAIRGKKVKGKTIQAVLFDALTEKELKAGDKSKMVKVFKQCDIVFISVPQQAKSPQADFRTILEALKGCAILTFGEQKGFIDSMKPKDPCGIINFIVDANKVRFEINLDEAQKNGFQVKAQVLKLAKRVVKRKKSAQ
jgi:YfiR/HmsC-like